MLPKASVLILTYNHAAFIVSAVQSVVDQITDFEYEILIGNDASSDDTIKKIQVFKDSKKVVIINRTKNIGAVKNEKELLAMAQGKYICYCEGDDYWTDPYKLQKQVDFLEAHPDYGLVHGDVNILNQETGVLSEAYNKTNNINIPSGDIYEFLMRPSHSIKTMTVCLRKEILDKYYLSNQEIMRQDWRLTDISLWLMLARVSKIKYFDEIFATYRLLPESMSRSKDPEKLFLFHQKIHAIRYYFMKNYGCPDSVKMLIETNKYRSMLSDAYALNNLGLAQKSISWLRTNHIKLNRKEKLLFMALRFPVLRYIIEWMR